MDWIVEGIAIGSIRDAMDPADLERAGIGAVLQIYGPEPFPLEFPFAAAVLHLFLVDGELIPASRLAEGVGFIQEQRSLGRQVFVTCGAGISRSPTFVTAYLHESGMDVLDALRLVAQRRPQALPHPALLRSLVEYYRLPTTAEVLLVALVKMRKGRTDRA